MTVQEATIQTQTQFEKDWEKPMMINSMEANRGYYNLVISIRDVSLWTKGIKPHRHWYITDVKKYFGISGSAEKVLNQLKDFRDSLFADNNDV